MNTRLHVYQRKDNTENYGLRTTADKERSLLESFCLRESVLFLRLFYKNLSIRCLCLFFFSYVNIHAVCVKTFNCLSMSNQADSVPVFA